MGDQFFPLASGSEGSSDSGDKKVKWLQSKVSAHRICSNRQEGRKEGRGQGRGQHRGHRGGTEGEIQPQASL